MIISKYLDIDTIDSNKSISCDESWSAFLLVNFFTIKWPSLCYTTYFDIILFFDSLDDWISNTCLFAPKKNPFTKMHKESSL